MTRRSKTNASKSKSWSLSELEARMMLAADAGAAVATNVAVADSPISDSPAAEISTALLVANQTTASELVFVDAGVDDISTLAEGVSLDAEFILLNSGRNAIDQISEVLSQRSNVTSLHIVSHGSAGQLHLSGSEVGVDQLNTHADQIEQWKHALTSDADILLYACDAAQGTAGNALIHRLAQLSGADVAASNDITGAADLGGDWDLELTTGAIESALVFSATTQADYRHTMGWGGSNSGPSGSHIDVRFRGDTGDEDFSVEVNGEVVAIWQADQSTQQYSIVVDEYITPDQVRINFFNDVYDQAGGYDRNLHIDAIAIDGVWFQTESSNVFSTGTWKSEDGITPGFRQSETLHTNGYFQFGAENALANVEARTEFGVDNDIEFLQDPTLATELVRVTDASYPGDGTGAQWDAPEPGSLPTTPPNFPGNVGTAVQPLKITDNIYAPGSDENRPNSGGLNEFSQFFGQFVTHDMVQSVRAAGPPIFYDGQFIPVSRTPAVPGADGVLNQVSSETPSLDLGLVYGKDEVATDLLREYHFIDGKWVAGASLISGGAGDVLPSYAEVAAQRGFEVTEVQSILGRTFLNLPPEASANQAATGDERANQTTSLTAHHTIWHRNHNWHVEQLRAQYGDWNEEQLYQAARALNEAEFQKVVYDEYLPSLIGEHALSQYSGFDSDVDPRIINEWTTVAFRFGHDQASDGQLVISETGEVNFVPLPVSSLIANGGQAIKSDGELGDWLRGQLAQNSQEIDGRIVGSLRNALFGVPADQDGNGGTSDEFIQLNLPLLDIHRGRDHGVGNYNALRAGLGLDTYDSLDEFATENGLSGERLNQLKSVYNDISEMDSIVGGLLEAKVHGSQLGEMFTVLNVMQFENTRDGDPYFYKNRFADAPEILNQIESTSMSGILTRIGAVDSAQPSAFHAPNIGSVLEINAAGTTGDEVMVLEINGEQVKSWQVGTTMEKFTYRADGPIGAYDVRIVFQNDAYDGENGYDRNLQVDNIVIDGWVHETEWNNVYSTGTWTENGLGEGYLNSEFLHSNGFFQFGW